jgi:hypothetical protein
LGMMNIIQVVAASAANRGTSKPAAAKVEGNGSTKTAAPAKTSKAATSAAQGTEKMKMN